MSETVMMMVIALALLLCWVLDRREREKEFGQERDLWHKERQQLLDRIQAPSFDHLKMAEVKVIKAQQPKEEEEKQFQYV